MSSPDLRLEHRILNDLKGLPKRPASVLLALSGGVDSMVMGEVLYKWRRGLKMRLAVAHIHHGAARTKAQADYRDEARAFVERWARSRDLQFFSNDPAPALNSEAEMRNFRSQCFARWCAEGEWQAVALGHHLDDLVETRLIRLIRGAGKQGLRGMCLYRHGRLRPLLQLSQAELRAYATRRALPWIEDPSNVQPQFLRNWLRHDWLPQLETKRPGAVRSLARSLELIAPRGVDFDLSPHVGLRRASLLAASADDRRRILAHYLKGIGLKDYGLSHVDEIAKRLNTRRKSFAFDLLGVRFEITPDFLWASRV